ncbi:unnamed protein product [Thlaspi arvense]|uniref:pectinesterase n=1 Tax=Thlaspi arvense TaxID=13288 RepID=A0AAU9S6A4_THLAR|nr:unnamed protein product [Thlaspi arvense]
MSIKVLLVTILSLSTITCPSSASLVLVVDLNGGGNFSSVQSAVDAVPESSPSKTIIIINSGVYREKVRVSKKKINIVLQGNGYENTFIEWNDTAQSSGKTSKSYSFGVFADNFIAHNISFKNTAPEPKPGVIGAQAVAVRIDGDQCAFYGCGFYGAQDTLFDNAGRQFFKNCFIQGSVDFIYGRGRSLYQDCTIRSIANEVTAGISGYITAQGRASEADQSGFSFVNCTIDGTGKVLLGRAWRAYAMFSNTYMSGIIAPDGWSDWRNLTYDKTVTFGEHRCYGEGANYKARVSYGKQLTDAEASAFTDITYIDGDKWLNQTDILSKVMVEEHLSSSY